MADAGMHVVVEGEKEFRQAIKGINEILKLNQTEVKRSAAEYNASDKGMDALAKRHKELENAIQTQIAAMASMTKELYGLEERYGENSTGVIKMKKAIDNAAIALAGMQGDLKATEEEIGKLTSATDPLIKSMEEMQKAQEKLQKEWDNYQNKLKETEKDIDAQIKALKAESEAAKNTEERNRLLSSAIDEQKDKLQILNEEMKTAVERYGAQSREVAEYRTAIANATVELSRMEKQLEDNNETVEEAEEIAIDVGDALKQVSEITGVKIPNGIEKMIGGLDAATASAAGLAAGVAGVAVGVAKATSAAVGQAVDYGASISQLADIYGLTTDAVQELQFTANILNVDFGGMADTLKDLRKNMYDASTGTEEMANEFASLGVNIYDTDGGLRDAYDVLIELIDAYGNVSNATERAARMQMLLGENSKSLNALIYAGGDALKYYREQAHESGYVMDKEFTAAAERAAQKTRELSEATKTVFRNFGAEFKESWDALWSGDFEKFLFGTGSSTKGSINAATNSWLDALLDKLTGNYANGTYNHPGGYALVGERGPEIVDLPAGSRVYPNGEYPATGTVNYYNITIPASDIREFNDIVRIAQSQRVTERMK